MTRSPSLDQPGVTFTAFGDMMRVPGGNGHAPPGESLGRRRARRLLAARRARSSRAIIPSDTWCSSRWGSRPPHPPPRSTLLRARDLGVENFSVFCNHVTIVPPIKAILDSPDLRLDGFIGPGHVSTVIGQRPYRFVPERYGKPLVTAGFEPLDVLTAWRCSWSSSATVAARSRTSTRGRCAKTETRRRCR